MGGSSRNLSYFRFGQTWSETKTLQIHLGTFGSSKLFVLSPTSRREVLFACPPLHWNPSFFIVEPTLLPPHAPALTLLFFPKVWLSLTSTLSHLPIWIYGSVSFPFGKCDSGILANCSLCGAASILSSADPVFLSLSAKACAILQALGWSRQHQQVYYFSFRISLCPRLTVIFSAFCVNSLARLA